MATITTRSGKGSPLTNNEVDANFTNLNTDKAELSGATFTGAITANAGVVVDNTTFDANKLATSSGNFFIDSAADIYLDADGANIFLRDDGVNFGRFNKNGNNLKIESSIQDGDIVFAGNDGGSGITALTLDMSNAGRAIFNAGAYFPDHVYLADNAKLTLGGGDDGTLYSDGTNIIQTSTGNLLLDVAGTVTIDADSSGEIKFADGGTSYVSTFTDGAYVYFNSLENDKDLRFRGKTGGNFVNALTLDMSAAGAATFNSSVTSTGLISGSLLNPANNSLTILGGGSATNNGANLTMYGGSASASAGDFRFRNGTTETARITAAGAATFAGAITANAGVLVDTTIIDGFLIYQNTSSGSDNSQLSLAGGGADSDGRGGRARLYGNQHSSKGGDVDISTGNVSGAQFDIFSTGNTTIDAGGDIILDADGGSINFKDGGVSFGSVFKSSSNMVVYSSISNGDMKFMGNDGGSNITALTLDMSAAGAATFNSSVTINSNLTLGENDSYVGFPSNGIYYNNSADHISVKTAATERFRIAADGFGDYVSSANDIIRFGGANSGSITFRNDTANQFVMHTGTSDDFVIGTGGNNDRLTITAAGAATFSGDVSVPNINVADDIRHTGDSDTYISFETNNQTFYAGGTRTLDLASGSSVFNEGGGDVDFRVESSGNDHMLFVDGGNNAVGIGTSSTAYPLTVEGYIGVRGGNGITFLNSSNNYTSDIYNGASSGTSDLRFKTQATERFKIASDGSLSTPTAGTSNVRFGSGAGISLASGGTRNTVVGDEAGTAITTGDNNVALGFRALYTEDTGNRSVAIGDFSLQNQNNADSNYNVGVGYAAGLAITTGVQNTLIGGLAGDSLTDSDYNVAVGYGALTSDTLGARNVAIGQEALASQNFTSVTNSYNTAVGMNAGRLVTTGIQNTLIGGLAGDALTDADHNTAIGSGALTSDTLGSRSTAIGAGALTFQNFTSATATYNTAVGYDAGNAVTTGVNNTLIGGLAGDAITTGSNNTAVGSQSLGANTTGGSNVAVGLASLAANTTASENTALGFASLNLNTTGASNTATGFFALAANTTGANNVANGYKALLSNTTASNNTAQGYFALSANTTGTSNVAVGALALDANTTASNNTAVGDGSLGANTTGASNTAVGKDALLVNTTASNNTAFGFQSLRLNTTGAVNTAVGANALDANTTGVANTAIGRQALTANTTANFNNAFGSEALASNTTGASNVAVGYAALTANTTASNNTAVGYASLTANTIGSENTAVGRLCLDANTTGQDNVAIGNSALGGNTTASNNTAVGSAALLANTTANNNTAVGYASLGSNTTGANNVSMGQGSSGANTTGGNNTAVGTEALNNNTTASNNTAFGFESLKANTTGANNTAVGINAGASITTGATNTLIGKDSGRFITTGANNTILGPYHGNQGGLDIRTSSNNIVLSDGVGNPRVYIDSSGNLNVAKTGSSMTTAGARLGVNGGSEIVSQGNNITALKIGSADDSYISLVEFYTYGGTQCGYILGNGSAVSLVSNSDYRLKENVVDLTGATERLKQLPVHRFNFINNPSETVDGFLAHEVADVVPEAAHGAKDAVDDDGNAVYQGIDQSKLVPLLVATIQELEARIAALESN